MEFALQVALGWLVGWLIGWLVGVWRADKGIIWHETDSFDC
jgi:hypothetical protein